LRRDLHSVPTRRSSDLKVANRNKRGISLDLRRPEGAQLLLRLLPAFDVLVENFRPGTLGRWGLSLEQLRQANPRIIVLRVTGFRSEEHTSELQSRENLV